MFVVTANGYLVECGSCGNEEYAKSIREAKNKFDFHECSKTPNEVFDYTLVEASSPIEYIQPMFSTDRY